MTDDRIERLTFTADAVGVWSSQSSRHVNWPVVYTLDDARSIYVGETGAAAARMRQHLHSPGKQGLTTAQIIVDGTFNKSVCLDLESYLIRLFAGDGAFEVLNGNSGITNADYYDRASYQRRFDRIFDELRDAGYFRRTIPQIVNSDLFKLSPFKALTPDQAIVVEDILEGLFEDVRSGAGSTVVIHGDPGTGKTILAIYLVKLLCDIRSQPGADEPPADTMFSEFFTDGHPELLQDFRIGLVVPQQSLRDSIRQVFRRTPSLDPGMVLTPFDVGESTGSFDLLIIDEAHRLNQLSAQAMGTLTRRFKEISESMFGEGWESRTQLDWIRAKSRHQVFLVDAAQRVRPSDVPPAALASLASGATERERAYRLTSQMRVKAGADYVGYVRRVLAGSQRARQEFPGYDLRLFDDFDAMYDLIRRRDDREGLSRLVAGYAWKWRSRKHPDEHDIALGSHRLCWNRTVKDWINSTGSLEEVGSIHTVQGYDLNYAGVVIGGDLRYDPEQDRMLFERSSYFDSRGKANNNLLGTTYSDADLLELVTNIYAVLLTRGMLGTYVYVCDEPLREYLRRFF